MFKFCPHLMKSNALFLSVTAGLAWSAVLAPDAIAQNSTAQSVNTLKPSMVQTSQSAKPISFNPKALRRMDFRVVGKSCAVCLMGIQRTVREKAGVVKVAVMLKKPYGAVIIYDGSKVTKDQLLKYSTSTDKDVKIESVTDFAIPKVPTILIPLYGIPKGTSDAKP